MNQEQLFWLVGILSCLALWLIAPLMYAFRYYRRAKSGEKAEMPEGYRSLAESISLGRNAFNRLRNPYAEEDARLEELAELRSKLKESEPNKD